MKSFEFFCFICISMLLISEAFGDTNCILRFANYTKIPSETWKNEIKLEALIDTTIPLTSLIQLEEFTFSDMTVNGKNYTGNYSYFGLSSETTPGKFHIQTRNFSQYYEENETEINILLSIKVKCGKDEYPLKLTVPIIDTNNHDPIFLHNSYEYKLPKSLEKNFDVTSVQEILVKDVDLTNANVTFAIDNADIQKKFSISFAGKDPKNVKHHRAKFVTNDNVNLEKDVTFTLTATDSGTPPRSTNATITFKIDEEPSKLLKFSRPLYTADLTSYDKNEKTNVSLAFLQGFITLSHGYEKDVQFQVSEIADELKKHFKFTPMSNESINAELVNLSNDFWNSGEDFVVVLKAFKTPDEAFTTLHIRMRSKCMEVSGSEEGVSNNSGKMSKLTTALLSIIGITVICCLIYVIIRKKQSIIDYWRFGK